jgi:hypothetical protein
MFCISLDSPNEPLTDMPEAVKESRLSLVTCFFVCFLICKHFCFMGFYLHKCIDWISQDIE